MQKERSAYIDILKAIGIISIVIGHSCWAIGTPVGELLLGPFVYLYHIMLFMFVGGFCYNDRYTKTPFVYIGKRIGSTLPLFAGYNMLFVLLHNILLERGLIAGEAYSHGGMLIQILMGTTYTHTETLVGACWFVPMYVCALGFFAVNEYVFDRIRKGKWSFLGVILLGTMGIWLNWKQISVSSYYIHTALLAVPIIWAGYQIRKYWEHIYKYLHWSGVLAAIAILCLVLHAHIGCVELSAFQIIHPALFYPVTFVGIYMCLGIAKHVEHWKLLSRAVAVVGRDSFHIMALHFLMLKIVDIVYAMMINDSVTDTTAFPHSYNLTLVYVIIGVAIPVLLVEGCRKCRVLFS